MMIKFRVIFNSNMNKFLWELNFNIPLEAFAYNLEKTKKIYSWELFFTKKMAIFLALCRFEPPKNGLINIVPVFSQ